MDEKKLKKLSLKLTSNRDDYMSAFRKNVFMFVEQKDITLSDIAEKADIPFSTLRSFLYGDATDCKLSTAVRLARAFNISVDELIGAETIEPETKECVALARNLKDHHRYVIRSFVRHQHLLHGDVPPKSKQISVMLPECYNGYLKTTTVSQALNVDHLQDGTKSRVCLGLKIPCEHYEPHYMKNEILLLAADRDGRNGEKCVVSHLGNMYICIKRIEQINGKKVVSYISLLDGKNVLFTSNEIDDKYGYVIGFLNPDGTWGVR